jgi:hypothetical protein
MKITMITALCVVAASIAAGSQSRAEMAAQHYPFCSQAASSATLTCYFRTREECPKFQLCVDNPWYVGPEHAQGASARASRAQLRRAH